MGLVVMLLLISDRLRGNSMWPLGWAVFTALWSQDGWAEETNLGHMKWKCLRKRKIFKILT